MITREQCLKWAEEAGIGFQENMNMAGKKSVTTTGSQKVEKIEALCQRVWNEAMEAAELEASGDYGNVYVAEAIRNLKVKP